MARFNHPWQPAPSDLELLSQDIHIWRADLDLPAIKIEELRQTLSVDEQERADRFRFEQPRNHFIAGRGFLRTILSCYLNLGPHQLRFSYHPRGKPELANLNAEEKLCFNLSHSNCLALYAVSRLNGQASQGNNSLGIDLEYMRSMPDAEKLAERFFSTKESQLISSLPVEQRQEAFFNGWTRKEAYLKATGDGLVGLSKVEVSLVPGETAALLSIEGDREAASRWSLYQLMAAPDYVAALAVEGHGWNLHYWVVG
ncbi:MAG: 4'-phosphopantetheinyl transferase superfamily protein [Coleofasciculaceae cyanobacterium]